MSLCSLTSLDCSGVTVWCYVMVCLHVVLLRCYVVVIRSLYCLYCVSCLCLRQSGSEGFLFFRRLCVSTAKLLSVFVGKGLNGCVLLGG